MQLGLLAVETAKSNQAELGWLMAEKGRICCSSLLLCTTQLGQGKHNPRLKPPTKQLIQTFLEQQPELAELG